MSITSEIQRLQTAKTNIRAAIQNKGVAVPTTVQLDAYPDYVAAISGGGGSTTIVPISITENGTYTAPAGSAYNPVTVAVGTPPITPDGNTHIRIQLNEERKSPKLGVRTSGTLQIDWGDGTSPDTLTGTSLTEPVWTNNHNYAHGGEYVITLTLGTSGSINFFGEYTSNKYSSILRNSENADVINNYYNKAVKEIVIGDRAYIGDYAFYGTNLESVYMSPNSGITGQRAFQACPLRGHIIIPDNALDIADYAFYLCRSITYIQIPQSINVIHQYAFSGCSGLKEIHLKPTTPPSISVNTFTNIPLDAIFYVPQGSLSTYQTASGWSTYASQMQEEAI